MDFRIADTFTDGLTRLNADEQKAVKMAAFELQLDPTSPGMSFHKLDKARDKHFWSVRVNDDVRLIVHKTESSLLLCYVAHHDKAYRWAERRKIETHPSTGAAQLVVIRETVKDVVIPNYVLTDVGKAPKARLFGGIPDDALLGYGVPSEWLADVRDATEDSLLALSSHLPSEAAEALLELATGGKPDVVKPAAKQLDPFAHPDAQRRFRTMASVEELERAFEYPWDKWTVFLHPAQRALVERDQSGPARVSGSAGTGKTIVALHRAVFLARANPDTRVLLTTFSEVLANALQARLRRLVSSEPHLGERVEVLSIEAIGERLFKPHLAGRTVIRDDAVTPLLKAAAAEVPGHKFTLKFLTTEWQQVVDAWQVGTWEEYRDVRRLGRKTRLAEPQRLLLWSIFERVGAQLSAKAWITQASLFTELATIVAASKHPPFDFVIVDEAQDIGVPHLKFFGALGGARPNGLFFAGDLGQRIFQQPFSWLALGVDVRGRARNLTVNYRTSHQIRVQADRLLGEVEEDVDGNTEDRNHTVSVFNGPAPTIQGFKDDKAESAAVGKWIADLHREGVAPHEFGVFVRSEAQMDRARAAVASSKLPCRVLDERVATVGGQVSACTMHHAKGLEFRAVAVMACDDEVVPLQERIETVSDEADLSEVYRTERHLLYVACTRARDHLLVTCVEPASELIEDFAR
jgi:mRNA-degrading endonuclease RelE of RelBE toxin-antitoxin system